jgi:hypothetical protein
MDTNKAAYWIALGVLALGLNSEYLKGNFVTLHRVADRAGAELCRISTRAEEAMLLATGVTSRRGILPDDVLAVADRGEMGREQADMIREQAELVREQVRNEMLAQREVLRARAGMRRAEIEQIRLRTRSDLRLATGTGRRVAVLCPKTGARIVVNADAESPDVSPDVEVEANF